MASNVSAMEAICTVNYYNELNCEYSIVVLTAYLYGGHQILRVH